MRELVNLFSLYYLCSRRKSIIKKLIRYFERPLLTSSEIYLKQLFVLEAQKTSDFDKSYNDLDKNSWILLKFVNYNGHSIVRSGITTASIVNKNKYLRSRYIVPMYTYIAMVTDPSLARNILVLKQPCGITFSRTFNRIPPGFYSCSIRIQIPKIQDIISQGVKIQKYNNNFVTKLSVTYNNCNCGDCDAAFVLNQAYLKPNFWNQLLTNKNFVGLEDSNLEILREPQYHKTQSKFCANWFIIKMKTPFMIRTTSGVTFEWKDVSKDESTKAGLWRTKMALDFVQLERLYSYHNICDHYQT